MHKQKKIKYSGQFLVRWSDKDGKKRSKTYPVYKDAQKALKWLRDNGSIDADIAISRDKLEEDTRKVIDSDYGKQGAT